MRLHFIAAILLVMALVAGVRAITVNPASAVTADSANTALTIPYRDASGNFAAGTITANISATSGPAVSVSSSASANFPFAFDGAYTSAQLVLKTPSAAGQLVYNVTLKLVCVSTGTTVFSYSLAGSAATCQ